MANAMSVPQEQPVYGSAESAGLNPFYGEWSLKMQLLAKSYLTITPKDA